MFRTGLAGPSAKAQRAGFWLPPRLLVLVSLCLPVAGQAEDIAQSSPEANAPMPRCGPPTEGQVYCKFGLVYECQLISPNSTDRRTGWLWKSDLLRGCAESSPAHVEHSNELPPNFTYAPQQSNQSDSQTSPGAADGSSGPDWRPRGGTLYIRPGGSASPNR